MGIQSKRAQRRAYEYQLSLDEMAAARNYEYGEMAAEEAYRRQQEQYQKELEDKSLVAQKADAEAAGLSPALLYGGGGAGGSASASSAPQGTGARGLESPSVAEIAQLGLQRKQLAIDGSRAGAEAALGYAEAKKIKAETKQIQEETITEQQARNVTIEEIKQRGWGQFLENARKDWEAKDVDKKGVELYYENVIYGDHAISNTPEFSKKEAAEILKLTSEAELNTEKKQGYWQELLNATKKADAEEMKATAIKLAAEWETGEFTNWKTWQRIATETIGGLSNILKIAQ